VEGLGLDGACVAPIPGVIAPLTPGSGGGACGVGASGTGVCCWATIPEAKTSPKPSSPAGAMAFQPFTAKSSSFKALDARGRFATRHSHGRPQLTEYQTRQRPAGCLPARKQARYALLGVQISSNRASCVWGVSEGLELPRCSLACRCWRRRGGLSLRPRLTRLR
jgi:hypothetical protein